MNIATLPSVKQMMNRMNDGHYRLLVATRDQTTVAMAFALPVSAIQGYRTCLSTLARWGCIDRGQITARGSELLEAWEQR